jgi:hypothetical protein
LERISKTTSYHKWLKSLGLKIVWVKIEEWEWERLLKGREKIEEIESEWERLFGFGSGWIWKGLLNFLIN